MAQRLKRWESPRREGRNDKGRGGSARQRQKQKQMQGLKQKLRQQNRSIDRDSINPEGNEAQEGRTFGSSLFSFKRPLSEVAA
ncbi:MAG: hypothetical protein HC772_02910 [Leptolyngbyaceae cyanobacterium CRU_2_3]|nr:hypothetical protein [Leptolyngbyaceae cyanobacterium CRU_2_3]